MRLVEHGPNSLPAPRPPSPWLRVLVQLRDPMILLLIAAAILTASLRDFTDLTVILVVVVLNTTVGVVQEIRAEHALAALSRLAAPHATVLRSGHTTVVPAVDVVPDDVVLLQAGDVVPADLVLFDRSSCRPTSPPSPANPFRSRKTRPTRCSPEPSSPAAAAPAASPGPDPAVPSARSLRCCRTSARGRRRCNAGSLGSAGR